MQKDLQRIEAKVDKVELLWKIFDEIQVLWAEGRHSKYSPLEDWM